MPGYRARTGAADCSVPVYCNPWCTTSERHPIRLSTRLGATGRSSSSRTRSCGVFLIALVNSADFGMPRMVYQDSNEEMHGQLWKAVRTGLIFRSEDSYRFL